VYTNYNTLSGLIYNNYNFNLLSISGILFEQNLIDTTQNNNISNNFNNLQGQINSNKNRSNKSSDDNTSGAIVNGVGTATLGVATAILFSAVFSTLASLQAQVTANDFYVETLNVRINLLNQRIIQLERNGRFLEQDVRDLQYKCHYLNRNVIDADLFIIGTIQQQIVNPIRKNVFNNDTIFKSSIQVNNDFNDAFLKQFRTTQLKP
jgi:hypothetical protein